MATGSRSGQGSTEQSGFSMVEILLVVALIGVMASIFVINFDTLIRQTETDSIEQAFWSASSEARNLALFERRVQDLRFDLESNTFLVGQGAGQKRFSVDISDWSEGVEAEVAFKQRLSDDSYSLVGGQLVTDREIALVRYFPDGTCMPFILEIRAGGEPRLIEIDPWSGAELLASDETR